MTVYVYTATNTTGVVPFANVTIRRKSDNAVAQLFDEDGNGIDNPITASSTGQYSFSAEPGIYLHALYESNCCSTIITEHVISGDEHMTQCECQTSNCTTMDEQTRLFLTNAGFLYTEVDCDGNVSERCHLNLTTLIHALGNALPTLSLPGDANLVVAALEDIVGVGTHSLELNNSGLELKNGTGAVLSSISYNAIAQKLVSVHSANTLRVASASDGLLFENDAVANP